MTRGLCRSEVRTETEMHREVPRTRRSVAQQRPNLQAGISQQIQSPASTASPSWGKKPSPGLVDSWRDPARLQLEKRSTRSTGAENSLSCMRNDTSRILVSICPVQLLSKYRPYQHLMDESEIIHHGCPTVYDANSLLSFPQLYKQTVFKSRMSYASPILGRWQCISFLLQHDHPKHTAENAN
jgi:hypothetical protein